MGMGLGKHLYNPSPQIVFEDYREYEVFRRKVEIAVARLGYTSVKEFLRELFEKLAETVPDIEEVKKERKAFLGKVLNMLRR